MVYHCERYKTPLYKRYIKMCKLAEKLQAEHDLQKGDCFFHSKYGVLEIVIIKNSIITATSEREVHCPLDKCIWIPSENQLTEMVGASSLDEFIDNNDKEKMGGPDSLKRALRTKVEKLLALYMFVEFDQLWIPPEQDWKRD